jgi:hypothetical protein
MRPRSRDILTNITANQRNYIFPFRSSSSDVDVVDVVDKD